MLVRLMSSQTQRNASPGHPIFGENSSPTSRKLARTERFDLRLNLVGAERYSFV